MATADLDQRGCKMAIRRLDDDTFFETMENSNRVSVVKFFTDECPLCEGVKPVFERVAQRLGQFCDFYEIRSSENPKAANRYSDDGVPTIVIFSPGASWFEAFEVPWMDGPSYAVVGGYPELHITEHLIRILDGVHGA